MRDNLSSAAPAFWRFIEQARSDGPTQGGRELCAQVNRSLGFDLQTQAYECSGLRALGAQAFAFNNGVYLDSGLAPSAFKQAFFHEIGHVLQQRSGRVWSNCADRVGFNFDSEFEAEADRIAGAVKLGEALPGWVFDAQSAGADVVQLLKLVTMSATEVAAWKKFVTSAKAAGATDPNLSKVLENSPSWAALQPLMKDFSDPLPSFKPGTAIGAYLAKYSSPAPSGGTAPTGTGASTGPKTAWGTTAVPSSKPASPPKLPTIVQSKSAADDPGALSAKHADQSWPELLKILKLTSKPTDVALVKANKMVTNSAATKEAEILLRFKDTVEYKFVLHFHPDPLNSNFLHFKNSLSALENHKVKWDHWAIKAAGIQELKFKAGKLT